MRKYFCLNFWARPRDAAYATRDDLCRFFFRFTPGEYDMFGESKWSDRRYSFALWRRNFYRVHFPFKNYLLWRENRKVQNANKVYLERLVDRLGIDGIQKLTAPSYSRMIAAGCNSHFTKAVLVWWRRDFYDGNIKERFYFEDDLIWLAKNADGGHPVPSDVPSREILAGMFEKAKPRARIERAKRRAKKD